MRLPSIKSHHAPHVSASERFSVEICCWICQQARQIFSPPFLPIRFIQATVSCLCVNVCVCGADWKIEIKFGWQAGSSTLSAYATPHYHSVLCPATQDFLTSLTSLSLSRLSHPDLSSLPPPISTFFTGQVVHLSHVWRPPEPTPLLSLLRLFRLFYEETHPRARKKQETQSR